MLVNVHNPTLDEVKSFPGANAFNVVSVRDNHTGGKVDLFIRADWSDWNAMVDKVTEYRQTAAVRSLGTEHGRAAGSWAIDGNTSSTETAQKIIAGYDDGDPEVMDMCVSPLRTERFDALAAEDVYEVAGIETDENGEGPDWLLVEYEAAYSSAYWDEMMRAARIIAEPVIVHTTCDDCGWEVEGVEGGTEWRDRWNCTVCPNGQQAHSVDA